MRGDDCKKGLIRLCYCYACVLRDYCQGLKRLRILSLQDPGAAVNIKDNSKTVQASASTFHLLRRFEGNILNSKFKLYLISPAFLLQVVKFV